MLKERWQDGVTLLAGLWFAVAPWALGYDFADHKGIFYNHLIVGAAIVLLSAGALARPKAWEEVVDFLLGLWALASPWIFGYGNMHSLRVNAVIVGLIVAVLALWIGAERGHFFERMRTNR
ncbi:MAG: repeat protein [Rhodocyclaceae bacterium]|nr:repeat protein [Rhodocyclaceae bacterium]